MDINNNANLKRMEVSKSKLHKIIEKLWKKATSGKKIETDSVEEMPADADNTVTITTNTIACNKRINNIKKQTNMDINNVNLKGMEVSKPTASKLHKIIEKLWEKATSGKKIETDSVDEMPADADNTENYPLVEDLLKLDLPNFLKGIKLSLDVFLYIYRVCGSDTFDF